MSKRAKYKFLSVPITALAGIFSCMLSATILTLNPIVAIVSLFAIVLLAFLIVGKVLFYSRFWQQWPPTKQNIIGWVFTTIVMVTFFSLNLWSFVEAGRAIQFEHNGVLAQAVIVDRRFEISHKGSDYYRLHTSGKLSMKMAKWLCLQVMIRQVGCPTLNRDWKSKFVI